MSMPQVRIHAANDVRIDEVDRPAVGDDDILVQVSLCGICGSDLGYVAAGGLGMTQPMPLGHELSGTVAEAGAHIRHVAVGDRVVVNPMANGGSIGNGGPEGGFAPYLLVRDAARHEQAVLKVPEALTTEQAALVEPLSVAMHGCRQGNATASDSAVVFGAGPIGLSAVVCLQHIGVKDIVSVDLSDKRLAVAKQLGAGTFNAGGDLDGFLIERHGQASVMGMPVPDSDLYIEATGVKPVFERITSLAKTGARIVVLGVHKEPVALDLVNLLIRELVVTGSMAYPSEFPAVIDMLRSGKPEVESIISHRYPLSQFDSALSQAQDADAAIKVMVDCQS